ncbi:MAG: hypothetical protein M1284_00295 [Candidatus Parvarchaeota archaeon]|jgi:hypothetical protein|nr:hypothetical protein [Candidatus Parvarchaeota archaeon]MCL5420182.1 hypothetical protein [Candidatus Parvarchaeota archaeon]
MKKTLEEIVVPKKFRNIVGMDIELDGFKEIYGEPVSFLGVELFFAEYGLFKKKTYLVLPHFNEKFSRLDKTYSGSSITLKIKRLERGKIEPMEYMIDNRDDSYSYPRLSRLKVQKVTCTYAHQDLKTANILK